MLSIDLYSDGYKIANSMDPFTYFDYKEEIIFDYNECPEVILEADEPTDLYAVVQDYTSRYSLTEFGINTIYKGYWIYNYNGPVQIKLAKIMDSYDIDDSGIAIWVSKGDFIKK